MNFWNHIRAGIAISCMFVNTLFLVALLYVLALGKLILPIQWFRVRISRGLTRVAETWIGINNLIIDTISRPRWTVEGREGLSKNQWYLLTSNHQSWSDILVLQYTFNRRIPFMKFFLKQELIKVPLLGLAWWALDFPFMKRHSREEIAKDPSLRLVDLETTQKACEKFQHFPTSVMNFFEGTRFTRAKHDEQQSPYKHLLRPKAGGAAFTLRAMAGTLQEMLDVTIIYPTGSPKTLMAFLGGAVREVRVVVRQRVIPDWASQGDYEGDAKFRERFQAWISDIWAEKDALLDERRG